MKPRINLYTLIIIFIYIIFRITTILKIEPHLVWIIDKQSIKETAPNIQSHCTPGILKKNYFLKDNSITFYSNTGSFIKSHTLKSGVLCSHGTGKYGIVLYYKDGEKIFYLDKNKGITWEHETYSYPFLTLNNRIIFLLTGENAGYSVLNAAGEVSGEPASSGIMLTSFDISSLSNYIIMGYANGNIKLFNHNLKILWFKKVLESRIQIVKKVSASSKGNYFAVLTGLEPEILTIINKNGMPEWKIRTGENRRRPIELLFSQNEEILAEESDTGVRLYSIESKEYLADIGLFSKSHKRRLINMDISFDGRFIITSYRITTNVSAVGLYDNTGHFYFRSYYIDETPFVAFSLDNYNFQVEIKNKIYLYSI